MQALNCTKETLLATLLNIDNTRRRGTIDCMQVKLNPATIPGLINIAPEDFCIDAIYTESNIFSLCKYFGLPTLSEIDAIIQEKHPELVGI